MKNNPTDLKYIYVRLNHQRQPSRGVIRKRYSENIQLIYWRKLAEV